jgi:phage terminase small subunit
MENFQNSLSDLQKRFVKEYIKDLNPSEAALRAGYKKSIAERTADMLLHDPAVVTEIKNTIKAHTKSLQVEKSYIVDKLIAIAEFCLTVEDVLDKDGSPTGKQKFRDTSAGLKAIEILHKYSGMGEQKISGLPVINTIENLNVKKL